MLDIKIKKFNELTIQELYSLLKLRSEIFVVEQDCVYQDLDGKDAKALHVIGIENNEVVAYTRVFKSGDYFDIASIGRVAVHKDRRKYGYGKDIMQASINVVNDKLKEQKIKISAQKYLSRFYTELGFKAIGEGYLEDGIPHIEMLKE
mgnify:FL=1|tara:strand:+ start:489 stop:932 length:444 start_codon:yes stop_codon:yes gene_type:complete